MGLESFYVHISNRQFLDFMVLGYTPNLVGLVHGLLLDINSKEKNSFGLLTSWV